MQLTVSTEINAPIAHVFSIMTDVARWPDTISGIESVEWLTGEPGSVGATFRETRRMHGRIASEDMTIAEIQPPSRFVLTAFSHGTRYEAVHELREERDGTRLELSFSGQPESLFARLMTPLGWLFRSAVCKQLLLDLADLKAVAER
ncbi:MAG: SRPBCC family protein [Alphaproteobacteria bacterium]|nr:SRPBCC family protein [Alphaproteobacteria bacterium]